MFDYSEIASQLRKLAPFDTESNEWADWQESVSAIAHEFEKGDKTFNRRHFVLNCVAAGRDNPTTWPK